LLIALATLLGALGAHALQHRLEPDRLATFEIAVRYQFFHALGLLAIGTLMTTSAVPRLIASAAMVIAGIVLFSGSLYFLAFGAPRAFGVVTPFGGVLLIGGWIAFAVSILRGRGSS
jgi:uncharacterized membrane protein YgdD (TMEM256/DUF423 family)